MFRLFDQNGRTVLVKPKVSRAALPELIAGLPPCAIGMEACSGAHYWARLFRQYGHEPRLMAAKFVRVKTNNYRDARSPLLAEATVKGSQSATEGKAYHYGFNYPSLGAQSDPDTNSGRFLSKLGHEQRLNQQVALSLRVLFPGKWWSWKVTCPQPFLTEY